jgi:hypothetical protein
MGAMSRLHRINMIIRITMISVQSVVEHQNYN